MVKDSKVSLDFLFHPRSVAIIGASSREGSFGRTFVDGFIRIGFHPFYPVHPTEKEILGIKAYPSIKEIPEEVDVAIVLTPPATVLKVLEECAEKYVKGIVIFTAGFGEKGVEGKRVEERILRMARERGTRIVGPNCIGLYCPSSRLLSFPLALIEGLPVESGKVGGFSQSGSLVDFLTLSACARGVRFSKVVSCGNECDLSAVDFLEYLGEDEETKVIIAYMEGIRQGRKFFQIAQRISRQKPILIWKAGVTEVGARAASSHTGALAGAGYLWEAMFRQAGIIGVSSSEELLDCLLAFYYQPVPKGRRVAIVASQGGAGVGTADACIRLGLDVVRLSDRTIHKLTPMISPVGATVDNPMDLGVTGGLLAPEVYGEAIKTVAEDENVDMILVIATPVEKGIRSICESAKGLSKPVLAALTKIPELARAEYELFGRNGVPLYPDPKRAAFVLSRMVCYSEYYRSE